MSEVTFDTIMNNADIREYIRASNHNLEVMGYTEHGIRHVSYVSKTACNILDELGYDARMCELASIAGWTHDIGNAVNRRHHGIIAANMMFTLLTSLKMKPEEISIIIGAIGNHEEEIGTPTNPVSAALIIADKSDSHRSRVRKTARLTDDDIHDRINLSIKKNYLTVDKQKKRIRLIIIMDSSGSVMDYMQIYLSRILLCEKAAKYLGCHFELVINGIVVNQRRRVIKKPKLEDDEKEVSVDF